MKSAIQNMSDDKATLTKVRLEYSDGRKEELTGDEAKRWFESANGAIMVATVHSCPFPEFKWDVIEGKTGD